MSVEGKRNNDNKNFDPVISLLTLTKRAENIKKKEMRKKKRLKKHNLIFIIISKVTSRGKE